jgi:hypothetical protein
MLNKIYKKEKNSHYSEEKRKEKKIEWGQESQDRRKGITCHCRK